jgi:hypothetical protein
LKGEGIHQGTEYNEGKQGGKDGLYPFIKKEINTQGPENKKPEKFIK